MAKELEDKIAWIRARHNEQSNIVEQLEIDRRLDRSGTALTRLKEAKREKLRLKDQLTWLMNVKKNLQ